MKKLTKIQKYEMLLELPDVKANELLTEFIEAEKALLMKKNAKSTSKVNTEKEENKNKILDCLEADTIYSVSDIIKTVPDFAGWNTQKVSPLCKSLAEDGLLTKVEDKKRTLYKLATTGA